jgi:hypothetical protein
MKTNINKVEKPSYRVMKLFSESTFMVARNAITFVGALSTNLFSIDGGSSHYSVGSGCDHLLSLMASNKTLSITDNASLYSLLKKLSGSEDPVRPPDLNSSVKSLQ